MQCGKKLGRVHDEEVPLFIQHTWVFSSPSARPLDFDPKLVVFLLRRFIRGIDFFFFFEEGAARVPPRSANSKMLNPNRENCVMEHRFRQERD